MATEKQLKTRITGTKNIEKITKSMKMVSAAKLRGDQNRLAAADPFSAWAQEITGKEVPLENLEPTNFPQNNLIIAMTSDKGLCGGVNSILSRQLKQLITKIDIAGKKSDVIILGEKGRSQLRRTLNDKLIVSIADRVVPYTFELACQVASEVLSSEKNYDAVHLVYNEFVSAIAYTPSVKSIKPLLDIPTAVADEQSTEFVKNINTISFEPDNDKDTLQNFYEYTLATQVFHSLLENATSEQSSRMNAMENASKNAGEMIGKLTLDYNRARQARITTELIEIISGASALN